MSDTITFSAGVSKEMQSKTKKLFYWLGTEQAHHRPLPPEHQHLLDTGNFDIHAYNKSGTLLHLAARAGNVDVVESLLTQGADINATNASATTALLVAAIAEKSETVQCLLDHQAEINPVITNGLTVLHSQMQRQPKDGRIIIPLLKLGADPNTRSVFGLPPLHDSNGREKIWALLNYGANINVKAQHRLMFWEEDVLNSCRKQAQPVFETWQNGKLEPQNLTQRNVMQLLNVWPLSDPKAPVPRFEQLDAIFSDARWKDEHAEHKLELIQQIPGLSSREQMFLMGGHARALIQKESAAKAQEAAR